MTSEFIKTVTNSACLLSKHRQSDVVEACDAQLIVEKNYNIKVPGFGIELSVDTVKKRKPKNEEHLEKVAVVREMTRKAGVVKRSSRLKAKQLNKTKSG
jgi:transcription initiation factor TFIID subunit TAF12